LGLLLSSSLQPTGRLLLFLPFDFSSYCKVSTLRINSHLICVCLYISIAYAFCQYVHKHFFIVLVQLHILALCDIMNKHLFESQI
jgi:hypothetical protein